MKRLWCWVVGHRWRTLRTNWTKALWLAHCHSMAGDDADCGRCGAEWRDFYGFGVTRENEHLYPDGLS